MTKIGNKVVNDSLTSSDILITDPNVNKWTCEPSNLTTFSSPSSDATNGTTESK
jgi:hypothetical protein